MPPKAVNLSDRQTTNQMMNRKIKTILIPIMIARELERNEQEMKVTRQVMTKLPPRKRIFSVRIQKNLTQTRILIRVELFIFALPTETMTKKVLETNFGVILDTDIEIGHIRNGKWKIISIKSSMGSKMIY